MLCFANKRGFVPKPTIVLSDVLHVGDKVKRSYSIRRSDTHPGFSGELIPTSLIVDRLEHAASVFMESKLTGKHASVGWFVDFEHKKWPQLESTIVVDAEVVKVDARKCTFNIVVKDDHGDVIGTGTHSRATIKYE